MNSTLIQNIVLMATAVGVEGNFSSEYKFDNGTMMVVSRNAMTGGGKHGYVAALPYDKAGKQIDERAEAWLTATEVAEKMAVLAEE